MSACIGCGTSSQRSLCALCWAERRDHQRAKAQARALAMTDRLERDPMTRPRQPIHAPTCDRPQPRESRVGSWTITRCPTCKATGIHRTQTDK